MSEAVPPSRPLDAPLRAATQFHRLHGRAAHGVWSAPGRVNLIGEHTDYNDGFVLPFALPHRVAVAAAPRGDGVLRAIAVGDDGRPQRSEPVPVAGLAPGSPTGWASYPAGVAWSLREHGIDLSAGADLVIVGDVPAGAGLSSSAALECAVGLALLGIADVSVDADDSPVSRSTLARLAQRAENDFVGAPTGILDQTASLRCVAGHLLFLDVRSGGSEQVPFALADQDLAILVIDTRANHQHSDSGYGDRRRGCERAAELLGLRSLREVTDADLDSALARLPAELQPLVRHVVTENERVLAMVEALHHGQFDRTGPLLTASHASLRDDYRVSCAELDVAVDVALAEGALGARMTGGGFGGSAIALVPTDLIDPLTARVSQAFADRAWPLPRTFVAVPSAGAGQDHLGASAAPGAR